MSFDEINTYLDAMKEKNDEQYKYDVTLQYLNAVFHNAKKPIEEYKKAMNIQDKPQTDDEMEKVARRLNQMFGGKVKKMKG